MGLDYRVWCRKNGEEAILFEGQGRTAFRFLSSWVGEERYGKDIKLSYADVLKLIEQAFIYAKTYYDKEELMYHVMNDISPLDQANDPLSFACRMKNVQMYMELLLDEAPEYFIECDW